jgi:hypothetical protein
MCEGQSVNLSQTGNRGWTVFSPDGQCEKVNAQSNYVVVMLNSFQLVDTLIGPTKFYWDDGIPFLNGATQSVAKAEHSQSYVTLAVTPHEPYTPYHVDLWLFCDECVVDNLFNKTWLKNEWKQVTLGFPSYDLTGIVSIKSMDRVFLQAVTVY